MMITAAVQVDAEELLPDKNSGTFTRAFLYLAFFLSGVSGLVYQIVWVRMLTRYLGSTTSATATVLCVFMTGLAAGAFGGGKLADKIRHRLFGYVILEISIAFTALLSSYVVIALFGSMYVNLYGFLGDNILVLGSVRVILAMLCLLPPTILMGATLPLLVAFSTRHYHYFQKGLGRLYSINTFGAVFGVFTTGFLLLGSVGESSSLLIAVGLNLLAAAIVFRLDLGLKTAEIAPSGSANPRTEPAAPPAYPRRARYCSRIAIFVSGFTAVAYEVLWARYLSLPLKTSIYAFSFMLGLFLAGIALGSWISTRFKVAVERPLAVFAFTEILIGFLTLAGIQIFSYLGKISAGYKINFYLGLITSTAIILPVAMAFGWQFPVAARCCIVDSYAPGKETGWAYSANTLGAIFGNIAAGFLLIPAIGTARSMVLLALLNITLGIILLGVSPREEQGKLPLFSGLLAVCIAVMVFQVGDPYKKVMYERVRQILGTNS